MTSQILLGAEICKRIPHQGTMCLLDRALSWDENSIVCTSMTHCNANNPLRTQGLLPAVCGIEYASQAMALHARLTGTGGTPGLLAAVRDAVLLVQRLDDIQDELTIQADKLAAQGKLALYQFRIFTRGRELLHGRLTVAFTADQL